MPGKVLVFESEKMSNKSDALYLVLKELMRSQTAQSKNKSRSSLDFMILIPEGLVALVIGGKGRQIKSLMDESGAEIVVN